MRRYSEYLNLINQKYGIGMPGGGMGSNMKAGGGGRGGEMTQIATSNSGNNFAPDPAIFNNYGMSGNSNAQSNNGQITSSSGMTSNNQQSMTSSSGWAPPCLKLTVNQAKLISSPRKQTAHQHKVSNNGEVGDNFIDAAYGTGQPPQFYKAGAGGSGGEETAKPTQMVYNVKQVPSSTGMSMGGGMGMGEENGYGQQQMVSPSAFFTQQSTTSIQALTQQIRRLPAVFYVDSRNPNSRRTEAMLRETYGLPLVSFYVDKIDNPEQVERNLQQLTAHKGMPYLFICGTFIGSQDHIDNYHNNKQIPQLVEYVCGENKSNSYSKKHRRKKKKKSKPKY
uniref:Glutaredoxin domain-containing protein n=1 Tax=Ditylenchus dipsaci TaxID=166011 RepID=A0A915D230_9BILA